MGRIRIGFSIKNIEILQKLNRRIYLTSISMVLVCE